VDYHFHSSPRISHKNITYNLTFCSIFINFHILWWVLFWSKYIHHVQNLHLLLTFLKNWLSQVPNFSNLPKVHNIIIKFGVHIFSIFWNVKSILCDNDFGWLKCAFTHEAPKPVILDFFGKVKRLTMQFLV
jgi:hypothetical protein